MKAIRVLVAVLLLLCYPIAAGARELSIDPDVLYQQFCEGTVSAEEILLLQDQGDLPIDFWKTYELNDDPLVKAAIAKWERQKQDEATAPDATEEPEGLPEQSQPTAIPEQVAPPVETSLPEGSVTVPSEEPPVIEEQTHTPEPTWQPDTATSVPVPSEAAETPAPSPAAQPPQESVSEEELPTATAPEGEAQNLGWEKDLGISFSSPPVLRYEVDFQNCMSIPQTPEYSTVDLFVSNLGDVPSVPLAIVANELEKTDDYGGFTVRFEPLVEDGFVIQAGESKQIGIFWYRQTTLEALPVMAENQTLLLEIGLQKAE